jgi:hypothetical protein
MAAREGQGLQIAVITFAMLTIILAITTYIFYAQSQTVQKDLDAKVKSLADKQKENDKLLARVVTMKYVLGLGGVTLPDVDVAKSKAADDAEIKEVLDGFTNDMALLGEQVAPEGPRNYRTYGNVLLAIVNKKNASVSDANAQTRAAQQAKDNFEKTEKARTDEAAAMADKASKDTAAQLATFNEDRARNEEEKKKLADQNAAGGARAKVEIDKVAGERDTYAKQYQQQQGTIRTQLDKLKEFEKEKTSLFESPDGHIKLVNQRQRLVWIDAGRADGLLRQTTFKVYDHDENGVTNAKPKGRIEVVSLGEHLSEARILEDTPSNPIISGDLIHTPAWSPGQRIHFAMAMKMDINKDRIDDYEMVKSIILMNGGVIDAELRPDGTRVGDISVNTRYFVEGEKPSDITSQDMQKQFNAFDLDRERHGVEKISVDKLLSLMGWKAEEKTVELAGNRSSDFRSKRAPGKTQPVGSQAPQPGAGGSAPSTPAPAAGGVDPFAGAAPAAKAAAPAADPFAVPPAGKAAPPEADPFAVPK